MKLYTVVWGRKTKIEFVWGQNPIMPSPILPSPQFHQATVTGIYTDIVYLMFYSACA